ncbi:enhanced serine sensitivity protein SseB C-terminal domain-containing protein [Pelosinus sp. IPA-1]|uniref:enhanced serine sensitivity protein SseB C-terminal domain-containing protein n=1 Tax=Pelosinus sp. IPA-1 TaxID=3029569 RepID=UPI0024362B23|nr:enhanced serine sensitivity protein SseB C-terminal domain-containing protein [Pelosinus sp. IPA-1]GMA98220.1 hypothetical protein PIPA1_10200 [Pelosinus sp. IPA-1]
MSDLRETLKKAISDPSMRPQFYEQLIKSDVFVITDGREMPIEKGVLQPGATVGIKTLKNPDDNPVIPVYSSLEQLQKSIQEKVIYLQLPCKELFSIIKGSYVVLDPNTEYMKEFPPEEIEAIVNGTIFVTGRQMVANKKTQVMIGQPAVYPQEIVDRLTSYFKRDTRVKKAYLAQFYNPESDDRAHPLIVIECAEEAYSDISGKAGMVVNAIVAPGEYVDMIRADSSNIALSVTKDFQPFYKKKWLGIF